MVEHIFTCDDCGVNVKDTNTKGVHYCPKCGEAMRWNWDNAAHGNKGDFYHESRSMGCPANQINKMMKKYPNSEYKKKGKSYVLVTRSVKEMDKRLKERGMVKFTKRDLVETDDI